MISPGWGGLNISIEPPFKLVVRVIQNEVLQRCVIPAKAGIQSPGTRGQVWMPAFAGMTLTFLSHPPILNDSRD
jgi:hypothetical protein